jgi:acetyl-CoA decarbonylase/synthase complex subunit gamma
VAAHKVKSGCGFSVVYGPVRARDIIAFMQAGMNAMDQMRQVRFSLYDRLILVPVELVTGAKYLLFAMAVLFILSGINAQGYSSEVALRDGVRSMSNLFAAYIGGAVIGPLLLPWLPGRSFSFKGLMAGLLVGSVLAVLGLVGGGAERIGWLFLVAAIASFITMNFTGASTYTSLSGVKKEMRVAVPLQVAAAVLGFSLWVVGRFV